MNDIVAAALTLSFIAQEPGNTSFAFIHHQFQDLPLPKWCLGAATDSEH